ncbi:unnamed protein product, partial [Didymodactylos carnosus]
MNTPWLQLFLSIRVFPQHVPSGGRICNGCGLLFSKWKHSYPEYTHVIEYVDSNCEKNEAEQGKDDDNDFEMKIDFPPLPETLPHESDFMFVPYVYIPKSEYTELQSRPEVLLIPFVDLSMNVSVTSHSMCCICREEIAAPSVTISESERERVF